MPDLGINLNVAYWLVLLSGLFVMATAFFLHGVLNFGDDGTVTPTLALFLTLFGLGGIVVLILTGSEAASIVASLLFSSGGAAAGYQFFFRRLAADDLTLRDRREDVVGKPAEVSLPIGPDSPGQITFTTASGRTTAMARSHDGSPIKQGSLVEVVQCVGTTYLVRPVGTGTLAKSSDPTS